MNTPVHESAPRQRKATKIGAIPQDDSQWKHVWVEDLKGELESYNQLDRYLDPVEAGGLGGELVKGYEGRRKKLVRYPMSVYLANQKEIEDRASRSISRRDAVSNIGISDKIEFGTPVSLGALPEVEAAAKMAASQVADEDLNG